MEGTTLRKKSTLFGWLGALAGVLIMVLFSGALGNQTALLMEPICTDLNISRTTFSSMISVTTFVNPLCSLVFAKFLVTLGLKKMTLIGSLGMVLYCAFVMVAGRVSSGAIVFIFIGHVCYGVGFSWASTMTVSILINNWFAKRSNTVISVVSAIGALASTISAPLITMWITNDGWQASILYRAIPVVITFVLFFFIIRVSPGANDKRIWEGEEKLADTASERDPSELPGMMLEEARKTKTFWFSLITIFGIGCFIYPAAAVCMPALVADFGYAESSGNVMAVLFAANMIATLVIGSLVEKFGCRKVFIPILLLTIVSMVVLSFKALGLGVLYLMAALIGIGYALIMVGVPMLTSETFGQKDFGRIQSFLFSAQVLGCVVGSPLLNIFYDNTGSYSLSYIISAVACAILIVTLILATANKPPRQNA